MSVEIKVGDCREILRSLGEGSVQCCVTSPPYFGLRDYGVAGQIGLEPTPAEYVAEMVAVFAEVRRVLKDDGTLWLNLGDSYANDWKWGGATGGKHAKGLHGSQVGRAKRNTGLPPKSLMLMPARVALALQADGWILRSENIWHKPNVMPENVSDRPTKAHEMVYQFTISPTGYYYDAATVSEPAVSDHPSGNGFAGRQGGSIRVGPQSGGEGSRKQWDGVGGQRNMRSVWTVPVSSAGGDHFATMAPGIADRCVRASSRVGDTVLDPFGGFGTTGLVADRHSRNALLIELNPTYAEMARKRIFDDAPLFGGAA